MIVGNDDEDDDNDDEEDNESDDGIDFDDDWPWLYPNQGFHGQWVNGVIWKSRLCATMKTPPEIWTIKDHLNLHLLKGSLRSPKLMNFQKIFEQLSTPPRPFFGNYIAISSHKPVAPSSILQWNFSDGKWPPPPPSFRSFFLEFRICFWKFIHFGERRLS